MTREQFEAHVRAEALKLLPDDFGLKGEPDDVFVSQARERVGYIAARMEHEWPLVEALRLAIGHLIEPTMMTLEYVPPSMRLRRAAEALDKREADINAIQFALSPYHTKPEAK